MALAFTMTGLPPVRKHCPSLGTQLPLPDPRAFIVLALSILNFPIRSLLNVEINLIL